MNQYLLDLHWAVTSPLLIESRSMPTKRYTQVETLASVHDVLGFDAELTDFLTPPPGRFVGKYFERLVLFYLQAIRKVRLLAHGFQIQDNARTVGELDFVFEDTDGAVVHWETAVKFYLHLPTTDDRSIEEPTGRRLIGPNPSDTFETKLKRIFEHQLPMGRRAFPEIDRAEPYVKGRIYYHPQYDPTFGIPPDLSSRHERGIWIRQSELHLLNERFDDGEIAVLQKPFWLAPAGRDPSRSRLLSWNETKEETQRHFLNLKRPLHLSVFDGQVGTMPVETERVFIVDNAWPNRD